MEKGRTSEELEAELKAMQLRLEEAEETLWAIRNNEIDALVVDGPQGQQVFTLQGAEQPYRVLMETMSEGALTIAPDGTILYCNRHFSELIETPLNRIIGESLHDFVMSQNEHSLEAMLLTCGREVCRGEFSLKEVHGREIPVSLSARSLVLGDVEGFCVVATDLTDQKRTQEALKEARDRLEERVERRTVKLRTEIMERKLAEEALRESEEKYRNLVKHAPAAIYEMDLEGMKFFSVNEAMCEILGYSREELLSIKPVDLLDQEDRLLFEERMRRKLAGEGIDETVEYRVRKKNGEWIDTAINVGLYTYTKEEPARVAVIGYDITERKRTEKKITRQSILLEAINRILREAITCESEEELGAACLSVAEELTDSKISFIGEIRSDGQLYGITVSNPGWDQCTLYEEGHPGSIGPFKIHGLYGHVMERGRSLLTNEPASHPESTGLPKGHPPLTAFLGVPLTENGKSVGLVAVGNREGGYSTEEQQILEALAPAVVQALSRKRVEAEVRASRDELELRVQDRTEELKQAYDKLVEETRERERVEQQLRQAQKIEALGTLAGGIAHDFNNLLAAIIGFTELLQEDLSVGDPSHRHATRVLEAGMRGRELVKQMLTFSRKSEQEKKPLRMSSIIKEGVKLLRASLPTTIRMNVNVASESGLVLADYVQIEQILMNLCTNAAHAMREKGGILDIELSDFSVGPGNVSPHSIEPGLYMKLTVRDTGIGIPAEIKDRIFDPFFTTKAVGEGTGLGLSVVMGIVRESSGHITVESEPGKGSTFAVYFPKVTVEPIVDIEGVEMLLPTGFERILLVDDEDVLLEMGEQTLTKLGYHVTSRLSSRAALALFRLDPSRFDLVITDQTMPELMGIDLAREIITIRPDVPVILCTGFSHLVDADAAKAAGIRGFAMKPLTKREIAKTIRDVLDR